MIIRMEVSEAKFFPSPCRKPERSDWRLTFLRFGLTQTHFTVPKSLHRAIPIALFMASRQLSTSFKQFAALFYWSPRVALFGSILTRRKPPVSRYFCHYERMTLVNEAEIVHSTNASNVLELRARSGRGVSNLARVELAWSSRGRRPARLPSLSCCPCALIPHARSKTHALYHPLFSELSV